MLHLIEAHVNVGFLEETLIKIRERFDEPRRIVGDFGRRFVQLTGAKMIDQMVTKLGLGRHGVRLAAAPGQWTAELTSWAPAVVAEAVELIVGNALASVFDIEPTGMNRNEMAKIESVTMRWRSDVGGGGRSAIAEGGTVGIVALTWPTDERELFRREVLMKISEGSSTVLTMTGIDSNGLHRVSIEVEVFARGRARLKD